MGFNSGFKGLKDSMLSNITKFHFYKKIILKR